MRRFQRGIVLNLWAVIVVVAGGCMANGRPSALPKSADGPLALDENRLEETTARSQRPDTDTAGRPPLPGGIQPVNAPGPRDSRLRLSVRAWVNAKPIFDEEVMTEVFVRMPPPSGQSGDPSKIMGERFNLALEKLIERELIYQDAYSKLVPNKKVLDKLNQAASKATDKKLQDILRANKVGSIEELNQKAKDQNFNLETWRKMEERDYIANEYVRSRIFPSIVKGTGHEAVREYYDQHLNQFQSLDRVEWQDIFLAVGGKHGNLAQARAAAGELMNKLRRGEPFDSLLKNDEGGSFAYRKGYGEGNRKGEIKPADVERYLFSMREGEVGPLVELSTGVHLFRLVKREYAGQLPFDEKVQAQILNKLRNDVAEREYNRVIRELKARSIIDYNKQPNR